MTSARRADLTRVGGDRRACRSERRTRRCSTTWRHCSQTSEASSIQTRRESDRRLAGIGRGPRGGRHLAEIEFVGPASARIVTEVVQQGDRRRLKRRSPARAALAGDVTPSISKRLLSHFALHQVLNARVRKRRLACRLPGDFQMHSTWSDGGDDRAYG
jgi:hypothetical protein